MIHPTIARAGLQRRHDPWRIRHARGSRRHENRRRSAVAPLVLIPRAGGNRKGRNGALWWERPRKSLCYADERGESLNEIATPKHRHKSWILLGVVLVPSLLLGASLGVGLKMDMPDVAALESYTPPLNTRVLAMDGTALASFGEQRRILIGYKDIPKVFEQALVAVEDANFYNHNGIDFQGIARAAWHDLTSLSFEQGASTLTQQLARNLFLVPDKTMRRKVQEMKLALEIERKYSKQEILTLYCNQVYMGHGRYGLEAASRFYFAKHAKDLDLPEAALLAGLIQRPEGLSPFRNPDRSLNRRNHVLNRMVDAG